MVENKNKTTEDFGLRITAEHHARIHTCAHAEPNFASWGKHR